MPGGAKGTQMNADEHGSGIFPEASPTTHPLKGPWRNKHAYDNGCDESQSGRTAEAQGGLNRLQIFRLTKKNG